MSKRRLFVVVSVAAVAVALGLWWRAGGREHDPAEGAPSVRAGVAGAGPVRVAEERDLRALPRSVIEGTVRDGAGAGVAGAEVCAWGYSDRLAGEDLREPACARTGAGGSYSLSDLVPARYGVGAMADGFLPGAWEGAGERPTFELAAGETRGSIDIVLERGGVELRGAVRDIGGGGVPGALVTASAFMGFRRASAFTRTDDEGEFTIRVPPGRQWLQAAAEGYGSGSADSAAPGPFVEILLTPESVLAGMVVEAGTGRPIAGAMVSVGGTGFQFRGGGGEQESRGSAYSDDRGRFRLTRLEPGRYKPVVRASELYGEAAESVLLGLGETRDDLVIEVHPAFTVSGRVLLGEGDAPCDRGWVSLTDRDHERRVSGSTDDRGEVSFRGVLPGRYQVDVNCHDKLAAERYEPVEVETADVRGLVWRVGDGGAIRGVVVSSGGAPVAGARVRAQQTGGDPRSQRSWGWTESGDDGRFEMKGLAGSSYQVRAESDAYPEMDEPVVVELAEDGQQEVRLELAAGGTIRGEVVDEDGTPVPGVAVRTVGRTWGGFGRDATTLDDGSFELRGVAPGRHRVVAQRDWSSALRAPGATDDDVHGRQVRVEAGRTVEVRLVVERRSGVITGKVVSEDGAPVGDAFISAQRESDATGAQSAWTRHRVRWGFSRRPVLTEQDGSFAVEELSPGTYTVRAYRRGGGEALAEGVAVGGSITLTIVSTGSIAGTVALDDGAVPDEFAVTVVDEQSGFSRSERFFRSEGRWVLRDLPAGEFVVSVAAAEGTDQQTVTLADGEERAGVALRLASRVTLTGRVIDLESGEPVAGMMIMAEPVKGGGDGRSVRITMGMGDGDKKHISDAEGRFELERVAAGRLYLTVFPTEWETSRYSFARRVITAPGGGKHDLGTISVPARRIEARDRPGDLGFQLEHSPPGTDPEEIRLTVSLVRPDGPAAQSGLTAGDVIVSVDGHDVTGGNLFLYASLTQVREGTTVRLGLDRGDEVSITAAGPL